MLTSIGETEKDRCDGNKLEEGGDGTKAGVGLARILCLSAKFWSEFSENSNKGFRVSWSTTYRGCSTTTVKHLNTHKFATAMGPSYCTLDFGRCFQKLPTNTDIERGQDRSAVLMSKLIQDTENMGGSNLYRLYQALVTQVEQRILQFGEKNLK